MSTFHTPVLAKEVIDALGIRRGKRYIDATAGGGGHALGIVEQGGIVLGIDADADAVAEARRNLRRVRPEAEEGKDWIIVKGNFRNVVTIAKDTGWENVEGMLFDLGVSSFELDTKERGFSYRFPDAPIDLRFDRTSGETGESLLRRLSEDDLYEILATYGEEQSARRIAHGIVRARSVRPVKTADGLMAIVKDAAQSRREIPGIAARVYQALRIAVNDEMGALREGLEGSRVLVKRGGRLVVLSFHSLEDRMVKQEMRTGPWHMVTKKPLTPNARELSQNRRARSAKLRVAEKL